MTAGLRVAQRLSWAAVALACLGAVCEGFIPLWHDMLRVAAGLILTSLVLTGIGLARVQREWKAMLDAEADDGD